MRSQSLYRALASAPEPSPVPTLVLTLPAAALVLVGGGCELEGGEIESCRELRVPVLPWPGRGVRRLDRGSLLFQLIVAVEVARQRGWPADGSSRGEAERLVAAACRRAGVSAARADGERIVADGETIGAVQVCSLGERAVVFGDLAAGAAGRGGPQPAALAEALVSTLEDALGVEFAPSLPTPEELEAIYLNDEILAREERTGLGRAAKPVVSPA